MHLEMIQKTEKLQNNAESQSDSDRQVKGWPLFQESCFWRFQPCIGWPNSSAVLTWANPHWNPLSLFGLKGRRKKKFVRDNPHHAPPPDD